MGHPVFMFLSFNCIYVCLNAFLFIHLFITYYYKKKNMRFVLFLKIKSQSSDS